MFTTDPVFHVDGDAVIPTAPLVWGDPDGVVTVPAHFRSDGASVPRLLWPLLGHPLDATLRRPAVLHDWECVIRITPSHRVHRRFYRALRAEGCARWRAALLYLGVRVAGPRWRSL